MTVVAAAIEPVKHNTRTSCHVESETIIAVLRDEDERRRAGAQSYKHAGVEKQGFIHFGTVWLAAQQLPRFECNAASMSSNDGDAVEEAAPLNKYRKLDGCNRVSRSGG